MARILKIAELGHPVLRENAKPVNDIQDAGFQELIDDMLATLADEGGFGLAAPQVHSSIRLFVMACHPSPKYPDAPHMDPMAVINPAIPSKSDDTIKGWERCLSIPGLRGRVPRHVEIEVTYTTQDGNRASIKLTGMPAIIFQHEYDHLEGLVYLDRITDTRELATEQEFMKIKNQT